MTTQTTMFTLDSIKRRARDNGSHWFDADTMRFFRTRLSARVYPTAAAGTLFVSSERGPDGVRRYSVRRCDLAGNVSTVGEFQAYRTAKAAHAAARELSRA